MKTWIVSRLDDRLAASKRDDVASEWLVITARERNGAMERLRHILRNRGCHMPNFYK